MKLRILLVTVLLAGLVLPVLADMAPPSPSPSSNGGVTFGVHSIERHPTPLGWFLIVLALATVIVLVGRGLVMLMRRRRLL